MAVGRKEVMILENEKAVEIQKPISMQVVELKNCLSSTLNNSPLPICVIEMVVRDIYADLVQITSTAYQKDVSCYETQLKNSKNISDTKTD